MSTMTYKVELNINGQNYSSYNEGFIIAKFEKEKLISLEGLFTCDYIKSQICNKEVILTYYELSEDYSYLELAFELTIKRAEFELPLIVEAYDEEKFLQLITTDIYTDKNNIEKCQKNMKDFKTTNLFKTIDFI